MSAPSLTNVVVGAYDTAGTVPVVFSGTPAVGSLLVAIVVGGSSFNPTLSSIADDATGGSNTWVLRVAQGVTNTLGNVDVSIWTAECVRTKASLTVTLTPNYGLYGRMIIGEITGANQTPTDTPNDYDSSVQPLVDFASTTDAETLLIGVVRGIIAGAIAFNLPGAPWSDVSTQALGDGAYYSVVSSQRTEPGSADLAWGAWASSNAWASCGMVVKAEGGAGGGGSTPNLLLLGVG